MARNWNAKLTPAKVKKALRVARERCTKPTSKHGFKRTKRATRKCIKRTTYKLLFGSAR